MVKSKLIYKYNFMQALKSGGKIPYFELYDQHENL